MKENKALFLALTSQLIWGVLPIYWKLLDFIEAYQILVQRMLWSLVSLHILLYFLKGKSYSKNLLADRSHWRVSILGGIFVSANWFIYIWAINNGYVLETSLGYYILPLITGLLGLIKGEKISSKLWIAYGFGLGGVIISTLALGRFPWLALALALSFALFTYFKKESPLDALDSLYTETAFVAPFALAYLFYSEFSGLGITGNFPPATWLLLATSGVVTALPLLLFGYAARALPLNITSFIQYLSPSITFLLGVFVFREAFDMTRLLSFILIWIGLIIFTKEQVEKRRKAQKKIPSSP